MRGTPSKTSSSRIAFVSTLWDSWGGSEELWSRTALRLVEEGSPVSASVLEWSPLHPRVLELRECGVDLWLRPRYYSWRRDPWTALWSRRRGPLSFAVELLIAARRPGLIVFSEGGPLPPLELLELCIERRVPFVTIGHANSDRRWQTDDTAARYREALARALRCYFVSRANLRLTEKQIGGALPNAEVVWNPVNLPDQTPPAWPALESDGTVNFACVGRLDPPHKGQDILFEALAGGAWKDRKWRLNLYGEGPMRKSLERLSESLGIGDRIYFSGFVAVRDIWAANHALVMPSRYEGMPLAMVEAMLCARPVVATDVAGHAEIILNNVTGFLAEAPTVSAMAAALERFWSRRHDAEIMGKAGAERIRRLVPPDPIGVFAGKIRELAAASYPS